MKASKALKISDKIWEVKQPSWWENLMYKINTERNHRKCLKRELDLVYAAIDYATKLGKYEVTVFMPVTPRCEYDVEYRLFKDGYGVHHCINNPPLSQRTMRITWYSGENDESK